MHLLTGLVTGIVSAACGALLLGHGGLITPSRPPSHGKPRLPPEDMILPLRPGGVVSYARVCQQRCHGEGDPEQRQRALRRRMRIYSARPIKDENRPLIPTDSEQYQFWSEAVVM